MVCGQLCSNRSFSIGRSATPDFCPRSVVEIPGACVVDLIRVEGRHSVDVGSQEDPWISASVGLGVDIAALFGLVLTSRIYEVWAISG